MRIPLRFIKKHTCNYTRLLAVIISIILTGIAGRTQAQVYYTFNDASSTSEADAIKKVNYDGTAITQLATNFTPSPSLIALDLPNNRAFVYEAFSSAPPAGLSIRVVNLANGTLTNTIPLTAVGGRIQAIRYDAQNDYIYYVVQDATPTTSSSTDGLYKVKPDGSGNVAVATAFSPNPELLALDIPNNRAFVYENLFASHGVYIINLTDGSTISHFSTSAGTGSLFGIEMEYDPQTDYLYFTTSDGNTGSPAVTTAPNDAVFKQKPDGTGYTVIASSICANPYAASFDFGHNLVYIPDQYSKNIYSVNLNSGTVSTFLSAATLGLAIGTNPLIAGIATPYRPLVTTNSPANILSASATVGGNITYSDVAVTDRGVVYSATNSTPTLSDSKFSIGSGTGTYSANLTGLLAVTTYYVRAYATSAAGTGYGPVTQFTTISNDATLSALSINPGPFTPGFSSTVTSYSESVPFATHIVTVTPAVNQVDATVKVNGRPVASGSPSGAVVLAQGDNAVTVQGIAQDQSVIKNYTITVTRAAPLLPVVTTGTPVNVTATSAFLGGKVVQSDTTVTDRGVVYSTTNTVPTLGDSKFAIGSGTGTYSSNLAGLSAAKTYYARAYATSMAGTAYGAVTSFTTPSKDATLSALTLNGGTLTPAFTLNNTVYTVNVPTSTTSVTVTPVVNQANATVTVSGTAVTPGNPTVVVNLTPGTNTITVTGTAQDGLTTATYTINAFRAFTPPGNALAFDGSNDGVSMGQPATAVSGSFTVEAWVKPNDADKEMHIFSTRNGTVPAFDIQIQNATTIHADIGDGTAWLNTSLDATYQYPVGQWMHIAYVITPGAYSIYINGSPAGNGAIPAGTPLLYNNATQVTIGYDPGENTYFNGSIDEVRVYNTALSKANIQADMVSTSPSVPASLVNYYNFDNGSAGNTNAGLTTLVDSKSGYNGTLSGFALTGTGSNWITSNAMIVPVATAPTNVTTTGFTANWTAPATGTVTGYQVEVSDIANFGEPVAGSPFRSSTTSVNITGSFASPKSGSHFLVQTST